MAKKKHRKERFLKLKMLVRRVKGFVVNPSVQFVAGLLCVAFVIFLTSSFLSFFSAGADDQSVVEAVASGDAAGNTSGKGGAVVADYFINRCFGWASILILPLLLLFSFHLMNLRKVRLAHWTVVTLFFVVWCSVLFDSLFGARFADSFMSPGGRNGELIKDFLYDMLGVVGVVIVLLFSLLLFMIYLSRNTIPWLQSILGFVSKKSVPDGEYTGVDDDEEEYAPVAEVVVAGDDKEECEDDDAEPEMEIDIDAADDEEDEECEGDAAVVVVEDVPVTENEVDADMELLMNDKGIIYIDDNRYALLMQDMKVWCDGETQWSYMREINEVYITDAAADEAQNLSPLYVMEHYREGFSRSAVSKDGFTAVMLKAMNEDSDVESVLLLISEENYRLVSMIISMPGQGAVEIDLDGYVAKCGVDDDVFTCPLDDFREAEIIDMR